MFKSISGNLLLFTVDQSQNVFAELRMPSKHHQSATANPSDPLTGHQSSYANSPSAIEINLFTYSATFVLAICNTVYSVTSPAS